MSKENALEKYTQAFEALNDHKVANQGVFEAHQNLLMRLMDAENELRDLVAEDEQGLENSKIKVTVVPQTQRMYSEDKMHQYLTPIQFADVVSDVKRPPRITIKPIK